MDNFCRVQTIRLWQLELVATTHTRIHPHWSISSFQDMQVFIAYNAEVVVARLAGLVHTACI